jgi:signal transduction histidine kinase
MGSRFKQGGDISWVASARENASPAALVVRGIAKTGQSNPIVQARRKERRRIAGVLHDELGQLLAVCQIKLQSVALESNDRALRDDLTAAMSTLDQAIAATRRLTSELDPRACLRDGFLPAVHRLAAYVRQHAALSVQVIPESDCRSSSSGKLSTLSFESQATLFAALRELLFNATKHARASTVRLEVRETNEHVELVVHDNGIGLPTTAAADEEPCAGYGLFSVRERLNEVGGTLEVKSQRGQGTRCRILVPLI